MEALYQLSYSPVRVAHDTSTVGAAEITVRPSPDPRDGSSARTVTGRSRAVGTMPE